MKQHNKKPRGFTLVELMITIAIIAILAGIAIPNLMGMLCHSRMAEGDAGMQTIGTALRVYAAKNGTFIVAAGVQWPQMNVDMQPGRRYTYCIATSGAPLINLGTINPPAGCPGGAQAPMAALNAFLASGHGNLDGDPALDIVFVDNANEPTHCALGICPNNDCMQ